MTQRSFSPLILLLLLSLPCPGCLRERNCGFTFQAGSGAPEIPESFGVNIDFTDPQPGEIKMLSEGGFRWVRMDLKWDATETKPGLYDFSAYDRLLETLKPYNIHTLFILDYGNPLYDNGAPPRTEATRQAFARWAVAAAKHFAGRDLLWEVYNEPNHSTFWPPEPNAQEYIELALAVGRAFRDSVPNEKLIGPATSEIDFSFVERCFKAGLLEYWAAVSIHPYRRSDPESAAEDYCRLRELIKRYSPVIAGSSSDQIKPKREIPIISSEWGYSSAWRSLSEQKQGELLPRTLLTNAANGISLSIWYDWRDDGLDPNEPEHHFGTVFNTYHVNREPVYNAKPTYLAARTLSAFFNGYRFEKRFDVGSSSDYVLAFRKGVTLRFAAWTTGDSHKVVVPLRLNQGSAIRHTGESVNLSSADQNSLAITLSSAPIYLR